MRENMGAARGRLPDAVLRRRMAADVERLQALLLLALLFPLLAPAWADRWRSRNGSP